MSERNFKTIVEGAYYRTANGELVGPAKQNIGGAEIYPWEVGHRTYTEDGYYYHDRRDHCYNLAARVNKDGTPLWVEQTEPTTEPEKRLPQPGEKWMTRGGFVAEIVQRLSHVYAIGGKVLKPDQAQHETWTITGFARHGREDHPNDLVEYIGPIEHLPVTEPEAGNAGDEQPQGKEFKLAIGGVYSTHDLAPHVDDGDFECDGSQLSVKLLDGRDAWFTKATGRLWECVGIGECDQAAPLVKQVVQDHDAELFSKALNGERGEDQQRIARSVASLGAKLLRKNADYGSAAWKRPILAPHIEAAAAIRVRMSDKLERIFTLAGKPPEVVAEPMADTLDDLVGYWVLLNSIPEQGK